MFLCQLAGWFVSRIAEKPPNAIPQKLDGGPRIDPNNFWCRIKGQISRNFGNDG